MTSTRTNRPLTSLLLGCSTVIVALSVSSAAASQPTLRCGAAAIDVTPRQLPVIRNGSFLEGQATRIVDPLHARCLVLDDASERLAIVVVDSCMIPLDVCERAKTLASQTTGIPVDHILISATHTHAAPSVMDYCLGSRADNAYRNFLPGKIAEAIHLANERLAPAQVGWAVADAHGYTKCRRWITRSDKFLVDPFGESSVHAMMHPGHQNPVYTGPAGPIDPWLSMLVVQSTAGEPMAVLANFSMHYYEGHAGVSADYFGRFASRIAARLAPDNPRFVGIMSQGTSGDLWWGDYSVPNDEKPFGSIDQFTDGLVELALDACQDIAYRSDVSLSMAEERLQLARRVPDPQRLAWARRLNQLRGDRLPKDRPEVYALQAVYLHENPTEEIVLQALRIGELGITAMPNEVYALTGLKLKRQSPLPTTFNISLANGASGYIPPPEQHALGGYTTWPARTAGLEVQAEPKIVETVMRLLEKVTGQPRRTYVEADTHYSQVIHASQPKAYWRLAEMRGPTAVDATPHGSSLRYVGQLAYHLPGRIGEALGAMHDTHAVHLAGGRLVADDLVLGESYTVEFFFYSAVPNDFRPTTATLLARGPDRLVVTGSASDTPGRLASGDVLGRNVIQPRSWHHVVFVRNGDFLQVFLDGHSKPEISQKVPRSKALSDQLTMGGDSRGVANLEGKLDEVSAYDRALTAREVQRHFRAAGVTVANINQRSLESFPLDPTQSMQRIHVREGFRVELVAAEPLIRDPVAIDWGPDGRLWVAEMADYPLGMDGQGKAGGRIRWLADTDDDGEYDKSVVFLEDVNFPNGVMAWQDGVLVSAAPEIFYAEDTDGDGVADLRQTLYAGFVEGNQQLRVNGLRWGLDNWIYCASGAHHAGFGAGNTIVSTKTDSRIVVGSRDFRFRPHDGRLDPQSGPSQYGRVRDDWGNWFGVQNSQPLWHYALADQYMRRNRHVPTIDPRRQVRVPRMPRVYSAKPPQKRFHGFDHAGHYTSACGISMYRDDLLFTRDTQHAFTCEPFHNLVQHHVLTHDGTSFQGQRGDDGPIDFFASSDRWCRPVMTRTGPDGALWVVDMYRYMIEHPEWLPSHGKEALRPAYREGDQFGRIYRIVPEAAATRTVPAIQSLSPQELVELLGDRNGLIRDSAHRLLLMKATSAEVPLLEHLAETHARAETRLQALCVLDGMDRLSTEALQAACTDTHAAVRRHAVRLAEINAADDEILRAAVRRLGTDKDAQVRLQVVCTLGGWNDEVSGRVLAEIALRTDNDAFLLAAITSSTEPHYAALIDQAIAHPERMPETLITTLLVMGADHRSDLARLLDRCILTDADQITPHQLRRVARWLDLLRDRNQTPSTLRAAKDDALANSIDHLAHMIGAARRIAASENRPINVRVAAMDLLGREPSRYDIDVRQLSRMLSPRVPGELQMAAVRGLARIPKPSVAAEFLGRWQQLLPEVRSAAIDVLLSRPEWVGELINELQQGNIAPVDFDLTHRQRLTSARDKRIAAAAHQVFGSSLRESRATVLQEYESVISLIGDATRGSQLYDQNCKSCHGLDAEQKPIGPDLRALTNRSPQALLSAILDPSQAVEPRYLNYNIVLQSGEVLVGVVVSENANSIEVAGADGKRRVILRDSIEVIQSSELSAMPAGFETKLTPLDMAHLIAFIGELGQ